MQKPKLTVDIGNDYEETDSLYHLIKETNDLDDLDDQGVQIRKSVLCDGTYEEGEIYKSKLNILEIDKILPKNNYEKNKLITENYIKKLFLTIILF